MHFHLSNSDIAALVLGGLFVLYLLIAGMSEALRIRRKNRRLKSHFCMFCGRPMKRHGQVPDHDALPIARLRRDFPTHRRWW